MVVRRSREGAWIEMVIKRDTLSTDMRRSREGAWIEIALRRWRNFGRMGRSREGAWIEIVAVDKSKVGDCGSLP